MKQVDFYTAKLNYETDSWDVSEAINNGDNLIVVDARSEQVYKLEHIPTAINLPHRNISSETTKHLD